MQIGKDYITMHQPDDWHANPAEGKICCTKTL